ncbi:MAG: type I-E CRISPR-associated protein Cas6/Cse3/CasE [Candidatus Nanoarchaeia archaeon]|jgi:CRISPR system Cascade subunit CasE|nr:type I-E CRISPR-associated protein Cas6/Cse3/CasE [Candidatus Nanoarchaeia archaeon]
MIATLYKIPRKDWKNTKTGDLYRSHQIIYGLFPDSKHRDFVFLDKGTTYNEKKFLIISKQVPKVPEYGEILIKKIPDLFFQKNKYKFETVLNPVKTLRTVDGTTKKPVIGIEQLSSWFLEKSQYWGFKVDSLSVSKTCAIEFFRKGENLILNSCTFSGILTVVNRSKFIESFENGIGRSRGFGFGLLQLVPIN